MTENEQVQSTSGEHKQVLESVSSIECKIVRASGRASVREFERVRAQFETACDNTTVIATFSSICLYCCFLFRGFSSSQK